MKNFNQKDMESIASSGMDLSESMRCASFLQQDNKVLLQRSLSDAVDILSTPQALKKFPRLKKYFGKSFKSLNRDYPKDTEGGYFIRVKKGRTVKLPIQACLFLKTKKFEQKVHNVIIVEEGARVYLITGCAASSVAHEGFHLGISEFFVQKGGYLNFTMVHSWREDVSVRPISIAMVEEGASFISNYVCLRPVREIIMYPTAVALGSGARVSFNSLILSHPSTLQDIGSRVIFKAKNAQAEIVARAVSLGGKVIARGHLKAEEQDVKAHLECRGLLLSKQGIIHAIPELETDFRDVDLSHEAAIGKISRDEIEYLCSRGFSQQEAQAIIIRGFMDIDILGLPQVLRKEIKELEDKTLKASL
ncbi:MAG: SufD family Fe-S cluster assembly protein [Candidatus Omnitrophota bacterium]|nr:MAG: SufD family Fe-S cluster assembly protein [Candidatus Omnitrophota bacterium]